MRRAWSFDNIYHTRRIRTTWGIDVIIAVSDVHLGWKDEGKQQRFMNFLERCDSPEIDHLVLLGDIFDFWRRSNGKIFCAEGCTCSGKAAEQTREKVKNNAEIIARLGQLQAKNVHYVVGNHDYLIYRLSKRNPKTYPFEVSKSLPLEEDGKRYFFTHGYDIDVYATMESLMSLDQYENVSECLCFLTDKTGWLASCLWGLSEKILELRDKVGSMQKPPEEREEDLDTITTFALSPAAFLFLGMGARDNLVYGHTHIPGSTKLDGGRYVANTGFWSGNDQCWYVKIDDEGVRHLNFRGEAIV